MDNKTPHISSGNETGSCHRPFGVTVLILVVLTFTSLNALRMITAIRTGNFLKDAASDVPVVYLVITGAVWLVVGIFFLYGLRARRKWTPTMALTAVTLYTIYYWFDRLLVADTSAIANRWPFALGFTILMMGLVFWTFTRPKTRAFFSK
jgi:hypothetical protein